MCKPWAFLPGPLGFLSVMRPSRKMTARSYSWTICKTTKNTSWVHVHSSKGSCGFSSSAHCAYLVISLTFRQNQIVMGKSRTVNRPASITMIQPHTPKDPVRSAEEREKQRDSVCLNVFGTLWHPYVDGELPCYDKRISSNYAYRELDLIQWDIQRFPSSSQASAAKKKINQLFKTGLRADNCNEYFPRVHSDLIVGLLLTFPAYLKCWV